MCALGVYGTRQDGILAWLGCPAQVTLKRRVFVGSMESFWACPAWAFGLIILRSQDDNSGLFKGLLSYMVWEVLLNLGSFTGVFAKLTVAYPNLRLIKP